MNTSIDVLASQASANGAGTREVELEATRVRIGLGIVLSIVLLIVLVAAAIFVFALATFPPSAQEFRSFLGSTAEVAQKAHDDRHAAWLGEIKDLVQLWIIALLIPLITTVIGYIFGRTVGDSDND